MTSPYKEAGLSGHSIVQAPKRRKEPTNRNDANKALRSTVYGHKWDWSTADHILGAGMEVCRICHHARYLVDGKRCRGKK